MRQHCTPVKQLDYDSFGNIIGDTHPAFTIPFGFAGGLHDSDTGLVRFGYRDYMPEIGKWTAKDPILFAGGDTNLFGYVLNDPVNFVDPTGEFRFGTRPLGSFPGKIGYNEGASNQRLLHEHGFYENGHNVGYFNRGIDKDSSSACSNYEMFGPYYDDAIMEIAENNLRNSGEWNKQGTSNGYDLINHNCQDFADALRNEYDRLQGPIYDNHIPISLDPFF